MTQRAKDAIASSGHVVGYKRYMGLVEPLLKGKNTISTNMTEEAERCSMAIELASRGEIVSVISSGDAGIYGMAGLLFEIAMKERGLGEKFNIEVIPGVPAFCAAAAMLGAPLMHDFASISLSDLLTPWEKIEKRIKSASESDFVVVLYNPKSSKRKEGLKRAMDIIRGFRAGETPVGIIRNAARGDESRMITTMNDFDGHIEKIDMLTIVVVGNSETFEDSGYMITPRGYRVS